MANLIERMQLDKQVLEKQKTIANKFNYGTSKADNAVKAIKHVNEGYRTNYETNPATIWNYSINKELNKPLYQSPTTTEIR